MEFKTLTPVRGMEKIKALRELIKGHGYIAGGYARYTVSPLELDDLAVPNDVDVFARHKEAFEYLKWKFVENWEIKSENDLAITFFYEGETTIQLIKPFREGAVGTLEGILERFDFTVTMAGITDEGTVLVHPDFEKDELSKRLRLLHVHCPVGSVRRFCKYAKKGYTFTLQEAAKLFVEYDKRSKEFKDKIYKIATIDPTKTKTAEERQEINSIYMEMFID